MRDHPPLTELAEIAASTATLPERARCLLERLDDWVPFDAAWLALSDPRSNVYETVGSNGLDRDVVDALDPPSVAQEIQLTGYNRRRRPFSVGELPVAADELPTWAECLAPAGFREGLGVALFEPDGRYMGMLSLLFASPRQPSNAMRDRLTQLAPLIARAVSPMRSLQATARLVRGAAAGAVLLQDGTTYPLAGLEDHAELATDSPVVGIAREFLRAGQVYRSFLWPTRADPEGRRHIRITVLSASDVPPFVLGMLIVTPDVASRGLTPRELQVLGLLVDGRSNQQIARTLAVAPRTVAAHVEHVLEKMEAPTRTVAAVLAEREGCYVPPLPAASPGGRRPG